MVQNKTIDRRRFQEGVGVLRFVKPTRSPWTL